MHSCEANNIECLIIATVVTAFNVIEAVRLKINALEMLRILGDAAITVNPLARYHFSSILDSP